MQGTWVRSLFGELRSHMQWSNETQALPLLKPAHSRAFTQLHSPCAVSEDPSCATKTQQWAPGAGDGQGGPACCYPWGRKESDTTERLNWTEDPLLFNVFFSLILCFWIVRTVDFSETGKNLMSGSSMFSSICLQTSYFISSPYCFLKYLAKSSKKKPTLPKSWFFKILFY